MGPIDTEKRHIFLKAKDPKSEMTRPKLKPTLPLIQKPEEKRTIESKRRNPWRKRMGSLRSRGRHEVDEIEQLSRESSHFSLSTGILPSLGARSNRRVRLKRFIVSPYDHKYRSHSIISCFSSLLCRVNKTSVLSGFRYFLTTLTWFFLYFDFRGSETQVFFLFLFFLWTQKFF